jgi:hypothetical protein
MDPEITEEMRRSALERGLDESQLKHAAALIEAYRTTYSYASQPAAFMGMPDDVLMGFLQFVSDDLGKMKKLMSESSGRAGALSEDPNVWMQAVFTLGLLAGVAYGRVQSA